MIINKSDSHCMRYLELLTTHEVKAYGVYDACCVSLNPPVITFTRSPAFPDIRVVLFTLRTDKGKKITGEMFIPLSPTSYAFLLELLTHLYTSRSTTYNSCNSSQTTYNSRGE